MSSTIDVSATNASATTADRRSNGSPQAASRIVHFDATQRRKQKKRQAALEGHKEIVQHESTSAATGTSARPAAPAPHVEPAPDAGGLNGGPRAESVSVDRVSPDRSADSTVCSAGPETPRTMSGRELQSFLIDFVVEQTGYPEEMVELDADLEADLGIDSIKKAQLFGELAEYFEVQVSDDLSLDDFPTLQHVVEFLEGVPQKDDAETASTAPPVSATTDLEPAEAMAEDMRRETDAETTSSPHRFAPSSIHRELAASDHPTSGLRGRDLEVFLIDFVVEQTGYPEEMVELDADLEADLGIDSIKKAQLFGELAEHFEVQVSEDLSLDDFPTLQHVVEFLEGVPCKQHAETSSTAFSSVAPHPVQSSSATDEEMRGTGDEGTGMNSGGAEATRSPYPLSTSSPDLDSTPNNLPASALSGGELEEFLVGFVVEQTGYPEEMVELDADLEADLGIDSIKKAQLFGELAEHFEVEVSEDLSLDDFPTLRHVVDFLEGVPRRTLA